MDRTERQKICKCGLDIGNLTNEIKIMSDQLTKLKIADYPTYIPAFRESINCIYRDIRNVEQSCGLDARQEQDNSSSVHYKIDEMELIKDDTKFNKLRVDMIDDLSRIRYGMIEKLKICSK